MGRGRRCAASCSGHSFYHGFGTRANTAASDGCQQGGRHRHRNVSPSSQNQARRSLSAPHWGVPSSRRQREPKRNEVLANRFMESTLHFRPEAASYFILSLAHPIRDRRVLHARTTSSATATRIPERADEPSRLATRPTRDGPESNH